VRVILAPIPVPAHDEPRLTPDNTPAFSGDWR
jgi:hypothetical protein